MRNQHPWSRVGQLTPSGSGTGTDTSLPALQERDPNAPLPPIPMADPAYVDPVYEMLRSGPLLPWTSMGGTGRPGPMGEWYNEGGTCLVGRALTPLAVYDYVLAERAVRLRRVLEPGMRFGVYQDTGDEWLHVAGSFPDGRWGRMGMIKKGLYGTQYEWEHVRCPGFDVSAIAQAGGVLLPAGPLVAVPGTGPTIDGGLQPSGSGTGTSDGARGVGYLQASIEAQRTRPLGR